MQGFKQNKLTWNMGTSGNRTNTLRNMFHSQLDLPHFRQFFSLFVYCSSIFCTIVKLDTFLYLRTIPTFSTIYLVYTEPKAWTAFHSKNDCWYNNMIPGVIQSLLMQMPSLCATTRQLWNQMFDVKIVGQIFLSCY